MPATHPGRCGGPWYPCSLPCSSAVSHGGLARVTACCSRVCGWQRRGYRLRRRPRRSTLRKRKGAHAVDLVTDLGAKPRRQTRSEADFDLIAPAEQLAPLHDCCCRTCELQVNCVPWYGVHEVSTASTHRPHRRLLQIATSHETSECCFMSCDEFIYRRDVGLSMTPGTVRYCTALYH